MAPLDFVVAVLELVALESIESIAEFLDSLAEVLEGLAPDVADLALGRAQLR